MPALPSPVSVVTGATGGIGRFVVLGLVRAGHLVVAVCRDAQRGRDLQAWIAARSTADRVEIVLADLSLLDAARGAARQIATDHPAIGLLVNNAGIFSARREQTAEGHESVLAVNHLAPFVLTRALLPALQAAAGASGARIVNVGSSTADRARIDPVDLEGRLHWGMVDAYSQSKLAITMATIEWARRLAGTGIVANVVHPGAVATGLVRARGAIGLVWRVAAPFLLTAEQGADTPLHVALSPEFAAITGAYVKRRRVVAPNRLAHDQALVEQVWRATETLAGP